MKLQFSDLDAVQRRVVQRLADEAGTLTPLITASAAHIGDRGKRKRFFFTIPKALRSMHTLQPG